MECSFADAANNHGFKRSRWRRLWRQQIQDYLIAAIQNIRICLARTVLQPAAAAVVALPGARLRFESFDFADQWACDSSDN